MTKTATVPVGPELDALVAERVFQFHREPQPKDCDGNFRGEEVLLPPGTTWDDLHVLGFSLPPRGRIALTYFTPSYSTIDYDALLALKQNRGRWYRQVIEITGKECTVMLDGGGQLAVGEGATIAEAAARAMLASGEA